MIALKIIKAIIGDASALSASFLTMGTAIAMESSVLGANAAILTTLAIEAVIGSAFAVLLP